MLDTLHWYLIMVTIVFCAKPGGSVGVYKPGTLPYRKNTTPAPITNEDPRNVTLLQPGVMTTLPSVSQNTSMQTPVMDRANVTMAQEPCSQQQQATTPAAPQMGNNELLGNASSALVDTLTNLFSQLTTCKPKKHYKSFCITLMDQPCSLFYSELFMELNVNTGGNVSRVCCKPKIFLGSYNRGEAEACRITDCLGLSQQSDPCSTMNPRYVRGRRMQYEPSLRHSCGNDAAVFMCCPRNSQMISQAAIYTAEENEFPHQVLIRPVNCGGTIYNKRFVITTHECVEACKAKKLTVVMSTNMADMTSSSSEYSVKKKYRHNELVLLQLKNDIQFSRKVKALPLAASDFDPWLYSDMAMIVGWAATSKGVAPGNLVKTQVVLRDGQYTKMSCLPGYNTMPGEQIICRGEEGNPVLCAISTSAYGGCEPGDYAKISEYRDWIWETAGPQSQIESTLQLTPMDGSPIAWIKHPYFVHVIPEFGESCGGTVIAEEFVLTAAQCVMRTDRTIVRTWYGEYIKVDMVKMFPKLGRTEQPINFDRGVGGMPVSGSIISNDLAILKLAREMDIKISEIPKLPENANEQFTEGEEIGFQTAMQLSNEPMRKRKFRMMDKMECKIRAMQISRTGIDFMPGKNVSCGMEVYSGGSSCNREIGGGLMCAGENGQLTVCGIQVFKHCGLSIPNLFVNVAAHREWIVKEIAEMRKGSWRRAIKKLVNGVVAFLKENPFRVFVAIFMLFMMFTDDKAMELRQLIDMIMMLLLA